MDLPRVALLLPTLLLANLGIAQGLHIGPEESTVETGDASPRHRVAEPRRRTGPARLVCKSLAIRATIVDGVATTELAQVYHNHSRRPAEAVWVLPLPKGATADHFTMTMNGEQVTGEVLDANRARAIYTSIVQQKRDPGLLEYIGNGCLRARVFPIPPSKDMRIEVRYRQVLPATTGIHQWRFPIRAATQRGLLPQQTTLDLRIRSRQALKNVYSPNPGVDVSRSSDHEARVSLELPRGTALQRDIDVFYGVSDAAVGLDLLTYRRADEAGYFMMMLSPRIAWDRKRALPRNIQFVVDTSGSMKGEKIEQARDALEFFLNSLNKQDHFDVIPFSTEPQPFFGKSVPATGKNIRRALKRAAALQARGGTNLHGALTKALAARRPKHRAAVGVTVFLTDGQPTVGEVRPGLILSDVRTKNVHKDRIFVFGVGDKVNATLLDKIAKDSHGDRDYVRPGENIELKTSALFTKLSHPVMSQVKIDCAGIEGFAIHPQTTPDLFRGSRLVLTGRYRGHGNHAIRVRGQIEGKEMEFVYEATFPKAAAEHDFITTLWAQRRVAMLLDNIRLNGAKKELLEEVRRLGKEHGIVTQHTSQLILEPHMRDRLGAGRRKVYRGPGNVVPPGPRTGGPTTGGRSTGGPTPVGPRTPGPTGPTTPGPSAPAAPGARTPTTGSDEFFLGSSRRGAIDYSVALKKLQSSKKLLTGAKVRRIGAFKMLDLGGLWVDARFKKGMEKKVRKVKAFSTSYFELLNRHADLPKVLALGPRILVIIDGQAIEVQ